MRMRFVLAVCLAVCAGGAWTAHAAAAEEDGGEQPARMQKLERILADAVNAWNAGRWVEAKAMLDKLVAEQINMTNEDAWKLREYFGVRLLQDMAGAVDKGRDFGRGAQVLLERADEHERQRLTDPAVIRQTVADVLGNPQNRRAMHRLTRIGCQAAPELIDSMRLAVEDDRRTNAILLLTRFGRPMTLPLTVALDGLNDRAEWDGDEAATAQRLVDILANITPADRRALPAVARLAEDERRPVGLREFAARAVERLAGALLHEGGEPRRAADYYYEEAERLHLLSAETRRELAQLQNLFFAWNPSERTDRDRIREGVNGTLVRQTVPDFAMNDLYAQYLALIGQRLENGAYAARFQALLARIWMDQATEIQELAGLAGLEAAQYPHAKHYQRQVEQWQKILLPAARLQAMNVGVEGLQDALYDALLAGKAPVTMALIDALRASARWPRVADHEGQPLLGALDHADYRIRQRAAIALTHMGLPVDHPRHADLVPPLVEGACTKIERLVLVVSQDADTRNAVAERLEAEGVRTVLATNGQEACRLAWQFPMKDAVLIDSEIEEFARLRQQLESLPLVGGSELPIVIITNPQREPAIRAQFEDLDDWKLLPKFTGSASVDPAERRQLDMGETERTARSLTNRFIVDASTPELFNRLAAMHRPDRPGQRVVAVLTNDNQEKREELAMYLRLVAERNATAHVRGELLDLLTRRRLQGDAPELRNVFSNVFLDDEIAGQNAMATIQALRNSPLTRSMPIGILAGERLSGDATGGTVNNRRAVEDAFKGLLQDEKETIQLVDYNLRSGELRDLVLAFSGNNPMVKLDYQKQWIGEAAFLSANALSQYARAEGQTLETAQSQTLGVALGDAARPLNVRVKVADALGHWTDVRSTRALASTFSNRENDESLRLASLQALGETDNEGVMHDMKEEALREETSDPLRAAAAIALAKEVATADKRAASVERICVTTPTRVAHMRLIGAPKAGDDTESADDGNESETPATKTDTDDDDW